MNKSKLKFVALSSERLGLPLDAHTELGNKDFRIRPVFVVSHSLDIESGKEKVEIEGFYTGLFDDA